MPPDRNHLPGAPDGTPRMFRHLRSAYVGHVFPPLPLTPSSVIARVLSSTTDLRRKLLSIFRTTSLVVFIFLRGPRHPCAHFSGDLLELTLEVRGAFEPIGTCCTLYRQASTVLWSLGAPTGPTPTTMRVEVFLPTIDHVQSY